MTREHQLAAQVFQLVQERKRRIEEVGGVYRSMLGTCSDRRRPVCRAEDMHAKGIEVG